MATSQDNLIPFNKRTEEEQRRIAKMGGIASGEARREKATFKKQLEMILDEKYNGEQTYREAITIGQILGAIDGKAENFKLLLSLLGELQEEQQTETPQVNINIVDHSNLESALYEDNT